MRFRKERAFLSTNPTFLGGGGDLRNDERARVGSTTRKRKENGRGKRKKNVTTAMMRFVSRTMMTPVARSLARTIMQMLRNVKKSIEMMMMKMMKIIGVKKNLDFVCLLMRVGRSAIFFSFFFHFRHIKKEINRLAH